MAKLYITEYTGTITPAAPDIVAEPAAVDQTPVTYSTSTQSAAFGSTTSIVRLHTDSICSVAFGTNPTATTSNRRMAANQTEYFIVPTGLAYKVAAVTNT
jgi:hypothetical protein